MLAHEKLTSVRQTLSEHQADALYITSPIDLYYFTGLKLSHGRLLITADTAVLIVSGIYYEMCLKALDIEVVHAQEVSLAECLKRSEFHDVRTIIFDSEVLSYQQFQELNDIILSSALPIKLKPLSRVLKKIRAIKSEEELWKIRSSCELCSLGFDYACTLFHKNISEREVAQELEIFWKKRSADDVSFEPIIAFGKNSALPHHRAGQTRLSKNDVILVDIGVKLNGYHSDMTRMVFFGSPDPKILEIYDIVKKAQQAALNLCCEGANSYDLDRAARKIIEDAGYGQEFVHRLGHGVGLEIHEYPTLSSEESQSVTLKAGMVITIEPGIYLTEIGGVRLEDTVIVSSNGFKDLTKRSHDPVWIPAP